MDKIFNLKIDTKNKNITTVTGLKQFDNNSVLNITLLQNSLAVDLSDCTVRINFLREDKRVLLYMTDIVSAKEGKVSIKLSPEVLEKYGLIKADISVFDSNLLKITSATFNLKVDKSIYSNDYYLDMKDFDIVQRMHIEEENRIKNEKTRIEAESNRITDEKKRSDAETTRIQKEEERNNSEDNRKKQEDLRNKAENARAEEESKRNEAEKTRINEEEKRSQNEQARMEAENKRKVTDADIAKNEKNRDDEEQKRVSNENKRITEETFRVSEELNRRKNEEIREANELLRKSKEVERLEKETKRIESETLREQNESKRIEQEEHRETVFKSMENTFNENAPGDMKKAIYDKDNDGIVDNAKLINGHAVFCDVPEDAKFTDTIYNDEKLIATIDNIAKNIKDGKVKQAEVADSVDWENIKNKPKSSGIDEKIIKELDLIKLNQMELVFQRELENKSTSMDAGYYVNVLTNKNKITTSDNSNINFNSDGATIKGEGQIKINNIKIPFKTDKITLYIKTKQHQLFSIDKQNEDGSIAFKCNVDWNVEVLD